MCAKGTRAHEQKFKDRRAEALRYRGKSEPMNLREGAGQDEGRRTNPSWAAQWFTAKANFYAAAVQKFPASDCAAGYPSAAKRLGMTSKA
jgi:hypothetical protein